jgi:hypothetical protein
MNLKAIKMEKAIIRIEEEIKALRIEIQSVWEITLDSVTLSILRAKLSGLEQALVICNEVNDFVEPTRNQRNGLKTLEFYLPMKVNLKYYW